MEEIKNNLENRKLELQTEIREMRQNRVIANKLEFHIQSNYFEFMERRIDNEIDYISKLIRYISGYNK